MTRQLTCIVLVGMAISVAMASTSMGRLDKYQVVQNSGTMKTACSKRAGSSSWYCTVEYIRNRVCEPGDGSCSPGGETVTTEAQCSRRPPRIGWRIKAATKSRAITGSIECERAAGETCDDRIYTCTHIALPR